MAEKIRQQIIKEVKEAKYYLNIVDSSPDVSHTDQFAFIIRYVKYKVSYEYFFDIFGKCRT